VFIFANKGKIKMSSSEYVNKKFKDLILACVSKSELSSWKRTTNSYNEINFEIENSPYKGWRISFAFNYYSERPINFVLRDPTYNTVASIVSFFDAESILYSIDYLLYLQDKRYIKLL